MKFFSVIAALLLIFGSARAAERSYTIEFGVTTPSTTSLTNNNFLGAVTSGNSYIEKVTSVVKVFPAADDYIRLSSNSDYGGFNLWLSESAQVVAKRIEFVAARYDSERDADASLMLNSETFYITETLPASYTLEIPSRPAYTLTNLIFHAEHRVNLYSITVVYDDSQGVVDPDVKTVATPQIIPAGGSVAAGTLVSVTCETQGAQIYYTIDGAVPTSASNLYSEPFPVYNDIEVKAFAVCQGMNASDVASAAFTVRNAEATLRSVFDFNNPASLNPAVAVPELKESVSLDKITFTDGAAAVRFDATGTGNTSVRLYNSYDAGCDARIYSGDCLTVSSLNPSYVITSIEFEMSESSGSDVNFTASEGYFDYMTSTWSAEGDAVDTVEFISVMQSRLKSMTVNLETTNGIENIAIDHDIPQQWYTIQGLRVPASVSRPGLYVRVKPGKTDKIIVK